MRQAHGVYDGPHSSARPETPSTSAGGFSSRPATALSHRSALPSSRPSSRPPSRPGTALSARREYRDMRDDVSVSVDEEVRRTMSARGPAPPAVPMEYHYVQ